jgi:hypothetical protein
MNTMKTAVEKTPPGAFSERISSLDRRVYHPLYHDESNVHSEKAVNNLHNPRKGRAKSNNKGS